MSEWTDPANPMLHYYDGDFPSGVIGPYAENFDTVVASQGLAHDLDRYRELAAAARGPVLELACGTGRVALPLALDGHEVVASDVSEIMLSRLEANRRRVEVDGRLRLEVVRADMRALALERRFALVILAFNSLLCLPDRRDQARALASAARHLLPDGRLVVDAVNPRALMLEGSPVPRPFFSRRDPTTGERYTRFAMASAMDADQVQTLHGWYDAVGDDGCVRRRPYATRWRPIFRFELELMLERAGLAIEKLEGGHCGEPFTAQSPHMFVIAKADA